MICPFCDYSQTKVLETRTVEEGTVIKRRRECLRCNRRFNTQERVESINLRVQKKDNSVVNFNQNKVFESLKKACYKRPITDTTLRKIALKIEREFWQEPEKIIASSEIGEKVMKELKELDQVAYVRYAAVYREFADLDSFMSEIKHLINKNETN